MNCDGRANKSRAAFAIALVVALGACSQGESAADSARSAPDNAKLETGLAIAYVTPSRGEGEIRLATPDGKPIRTLFRVPKGTPSGDGADELVWSPNGQWLAFSSSHDWQRSTSIRDIYVVRRTGGPLKRPTNAPDSGEYENYRTGKVKVTVASVATQSSEMWAFVEGAKNAEQFTGVKGNAYIVTFDDVADFGKGVRQYVRVFRTPADAFGSCWMDLGVFVDVEPGETVDAGSLSWSNRVNCTRQFSPTWIDDETIAGLTIELPYSAFNSNNVWEFAANGGAGAAGRRLIDWRRVNGSTRLSAIAGGPKRADGQYLAMLIPQSFVSAVALASTDDYDNLSYANMERCPTMACRIFGLAWRPDGGALFLSETQRASGGPEPRDNSVLYELDATGARREFLRLPNEVIGRIAVSPDGKSVAFERARRAVDTIDTVQFGNLAQCPCSIWLVNTDGSNLREFAANGRSPAWTH